ncbi:MAG: DUF21 domain-containing protein [Phycisphaeraceae bacterium]|nr:DUF21 domain-containing protein [Phycisphaeraceae bacterium]
MTLEVALFFTLLIALGVLLSALCSGIETGIYTTNRVRLALRVAEGQRRARILRDEMDHPNRLLAALLIANTIANDFVAIGISRVLHGVGLGPFGAVVVNTMIVVPILFIFGEVIPKDLFRRSADRATQALAPGLRAARLLLTWCGLVPLVQGTSTAVLRLLGAEPDAPLTSRQRLARIFEEGVGSGALSEEQVSLAERVMGVAGRTVAERMIPWRRASVIRANLDQPVRHVTVRGDGFSRYPVVGSDGRVIGVVAALDLLTAPERSLGEVVHNACWVDPGTRLLEALEVLRRERAKLAVVGSPKGGPVGVITLSDLVEPLVGSFKGDL